MRLLITFLSMGFLMLGSPAIALDCNAVVNDDAHVISDVAKVSASARRAGNQGGMIRIVTFDTLPNDVPLSKRLTTLRNDCPTWANTTKTAIDPSTVLVGYLKHGHNQKGDPEIGMNVGGYLTAKIKDQNALLSGALVPSMKLFKHGDTNAMTDGFIRTSDEITAQLSQRIGGSAVPVTIYHATDYSGLWRAIGFLFFIVACVIGYYFYRSTKKDDDATSAAQAEAKRVRSEAVSGFNSLQTGMTILDARASASNDLKPLFADYKTLVQQGNASLNTFDNLSGENPLDRKMPVDAYKNYQRRYETLIAENINPAKELARQIRAGQPDAPRQAPPPPPAAPQAPFPSTPSQTYREPPAPDQGTFVPRQDAPYQPPQAAPAWNTPPQTPSSYQAPASAPYTPPQDNLFLDGLIAGGAAGALGESLLGRRHDDGGYERGRRDAEREEQRRRDRDDEQHREDQRRQDRDDDRRQQDDDDDDTSTVSAAPSRRAPEPEEQTSSFTPDLDDDEPEESSSSFSVDLDDD